MPVECGRREQREIQLGESSSADTGQVMPIAAALRG
jgi:hypothetical protein